MEGLVIAIMCFIILSIIVIAGGVVLTTAPGWVIGALVLYFMLR